MRAIRYDGRNRGGEGTIREVLAVRQHRARPRGAPFGQEPIEIAEYSKSCVYATCANHVIQQKLKIISIVGSESPIALTLVFIGGDEAFMQRGCGRGRRFARWQFTRSSEPAGGGRQGSRGKDTGGTLRLP